MQISFRFETAYGPFSDALILEDDHGLDDAQIEAMKQTRLDNWLAVVSIQSEDLNVIDVEAHMVADDTQVVDEA